MSYQSINFYSSSTQEFLMATIDLFSLYGEDYPYSVSYPGGQPTNVTSWTDGNTIDPSITVSENGSTLSVWPSPPLTIVYLSTDGYGIGEYYPIYSINTTYQLDNTYGSSPNNFYKVSQSATFNGDFYSVSSPSILSYPSGYIVGSNGTFFAYSTAPVIIYFVTLSDAEANTNPIFGTDDYVVRSNGNIVAWYIASTSTGSSLQTGEYVVGSTLVNDGTYYLYPSAGSNVFYYTNKTDALAQTNPIYSLNSYVIVGSYSDWIVASNSTGTSSSIAIYPTGTTLNEDGEYYLYPASSSDYSIIYFSSEISASSNLSYMLSNGGISSTYTLSNLYGVSDWTVYSGYSQISIAAGSIIATSVLTGSLFLYPTTVNTVFYYSESNDSLFTNVYSNDNSIIGLSSSYTVETVNGFSNWTLAPTSTGSSLQLNSYSTGSILNESGSYYLYPGFIYSSLYVAVGANNNSSITTVYSLDGSTWNASTSNPFSGGIGYKVAYNGSNLWVAVGYNTNSSITAAYSSNGMIWYASSNNPFPGGAGHGIAWNGSLWMAVGNNSNNSITASTSSNGSTWTSTAINPFPGGIAYGIVRGNTSTRWLIVGRNSNSSITSAFTNTNGSTWSFSSTGDAFKNSGGAGGRGRGIAWNGSNRWVAVGFNTTSGNDSTSSTVTAVYSTNGVDWSNAANSPFGVGGIGYSVAWSGSNWIAVGTNSSHSQTGAISINGINWFNLNTQPFIGGSGYGNGFGIAWDGIGRWCAVGNSYDGGGGNPTPTAALSTNVNGLSWDSGSDPFPGYPTSAGWGIAIESGEPRVFYYNTKSDALATSNSIGSSFSYNVAKVGGYSNWVLASNSTGLSSQIVVYTEGSSLNNNDYYFLYPLPVAAGSYQIRYFSSELSASSNLFPSLLAINSGTQNTYTVLSLLGVSNWTVYSGFTTTPITTIPAGSVIAKPLFMNPTTLQGTLLLYPTISNVIFYYSESNDSLFTNVTANESRIIGLSSSYTVETVSGFSNWILAPTSTGSSDQTNSYSTGFILNGDGVYYVYPGSRGTVVANVYYYANKTDALAQTNSISSSMSYTITSVEGNSDWVLASNSTGSSTRILVYASGSLLNESGQYYLYPVTSTLFTVKYFSSSISASSNLSHMLSNTGTSSSYTLSNLNGVSNWTVHSGFTTTIVPGGSILATDVFTGDLFVYPTTTNYVYYYSQSNANIYTNENYIIFLSSNYTLQTVNTNSEWIIAPTSTGSSSQILVYTSGSALNTISNYYIYPLPATSTAYSIKYFSSEISASSNLSHMLSNGGSSNKYTLSNLYGVSNWTVQNGINLPEGSVIATSVVNNLSLYPSATHVLFYYSESNASLLTNVLANDNRIIRLSTSYTVETVNTTSEWILAPTSTGLSPQTNSYSTGSILNGNGVYYVYPGSIGTVVDNVYYYANKTDALAQTNLIDSSTSYTVSTIEEYSNWVLAANSTGSSTRILVYASGSVLNESGQYYLYPPTSTAYVVKYFSSRSSADSNLSYMLSNGNSSTSYTLSNLNGVSNWTVHSGFTTTIVPGGSILATDVFTGNLFVYPTTSNYIFYYSQSNANIYTNENYIIFLSSNYTLQTVNTNSEWIIAPTSTGSSSQILVHPSASTLIRNGNYYVYPLPATSTSYSMKYFSSQISASSNLSHMLSNGGSSNKYTLSNLYGVSNWTVQNGINLPGGSVIATSVANNLSLYPSATHVLYYYSESNASLLTNVLANDNRIIRLSTSYTVETVNTTSEWILAPTSTGLSPQTISYTSGYTLNGNILKRRNYYLYPGTTGSNVFYYTNQTDALANINAFASSNSYTVGSVGGYSSWHIASNSTGASSQAGVYPSGIELEPENIYYLYPSIPCFLEGTKILCLIDYKEEYVNIESIRKGTLVKTSLHGYKEVTYIGYSSITNYDSTERLENRLYICKKDVYPTLNEDLILTGTHSILVDTLTDKQREETIKSLDRIFITGDKYRLMAFLDPSAEPWASEGVYTVWHLALDHSDIFKNYGIYANGLLVESASIRFLKDKSNMIFV
jgi:hypothetical protein